MLHAEGRAGSKDLLKTSEHLPAQQRPSKLGKMAFESLKNKHKHKKKEILKDHSKGILDKLFEKETIHVNFSLGFMKSCQDEQHL